LIGILALGVKLYPQHPISLRLPTSIGLDDTVIFKCYSDRPPVTEHTVELSCRSEKLILKPVAHS